MDRPDAPPPAPRWLEEIAAKPADAAVDARGRTGFYLSYRHFSALFAMRGSERLVVSFDNLSTVRDRSPARDTWGGAFLRERGWSSLGILAYAANWYRDPDLFAFLEGLRDDGFFRQFREVAFTGTSMGGYAACAFAGLSPGATVVAFSPQSTLAKRLVPWEKRFNRGRKEDWSGPYADGAAEVREARRVYLVYDPFVAGDRRHAERFHGPQVVRLRAVCSGHRTVVFLRKAEILKEVMAGGIEGSLTADAFYRAYRARRTLPWHSLALMEMALRRPGPALAERLVSANERLGRPRLAETLRRRLAGGEAEADPGPGEDG